ncbi:Os08g0195500 [Oryza sativa Japonica Group]|uniref:Os08g0195500 protein n=1 Tax=Oryza sativa subsp. japonica TaxID=39947 RepID=A0A0P0XCV1_ORYSJ|nr:Os08g0195500 [Oryza sativa Japonica Group]
MRGRGHGHAGAGLRGMAQAAVSRSKGQCEAFRSQHAVDDGFLLFLGETSSSQCKVHMGEVINHQTDRSRRICHNSSNHHTRHNLQGRKEA